MFEIIWKSLQVNKDTLDEVIEEINREISRISANRIPYLTGRALKKELVRVQELRNQRDIIKKKFGTATPKNSADNEIDETDKDMGVENAGNIPVSLLARQDLSETEKSEDYVTGDYIHLYNKRAKIKWRDGHGNYQVEFLDGKDKGKTMIVPENEIDKMISKNIDLIIKKYE
jgi:hypothetical protein